MLHSFDHITVPLRLVYPLQSNQYMFHPPRLQWRHHEFENGGGVNALEGAGVNTVKTLKFEKGGGCMTLPVPQLLRWHHPHRLHQCVFVMFHTGI